MRLFKLIFLLILFSITSFSQANNLLLDDVDINLNITPTQQKPLARALWLTSEYGALPIEKNLAQQLAQLGIESWQPDIFEAFLAAPTPSSLQEIPANLVAQIIAEAHKDNLPLFIIAPNMAAQLAAKGLEIYQETPQNNLGLVLLNPNFYPSTPTPGEDPQYISSTSQLNIPSFIIQAELSPWYWQLDKLKSLIKKSGSPVEAKIAKKMRDRFYFRPDAYPVEKDFTQEELLDQLISAMQFITQEMPQARIAGNPTSQRPTKSASSKRSDQLNIYQGEQNRGFKLQDLDNNWVNLSDYQGKTVLLNFWASWCPPCLHEMPSMARLKSQLKDEPFEIVAVNLAQEKSEFEEFLDSMSLNFPILLDPQGSSIKSWKVTAYPTTYLLDKTGKIRYSLFGGTEWDEADKVEVIRQLIAE